MAFYYEHEGYCPVCLSPAKFVARDPWFRDHYRCQRCGSIPRERALLLVLEDLFPEWRSLRIHESSPGLPSSALLARECPGYVASHFFPGVTLGSEHHGFRCENLEKLTFPDSSFDLVVTQDVLEHVFDYRQAFLEIARTLRPGGAHIFTTPKYKGLRHTTDRARLIDGKVMHLSEPEYHGNPIDTGGSLVTVHYGDDICDIIWHAARTATTTYLIKDERTGTIAEFMEVFVSRKGSPIETRDPSA